jgi:hypothetical protein
MTLKATCLDIEVKSDALNRHELDEQSHLLWQEGQGQRLGLYCKEGKHKPPLSKGADHLSPVLKQP